VTSSPPAPTTTSRPERSREPRTFAPIIWRWVIQVHLLLADRSAEVINGGRVNVYPAEVDAMLLALYKCPRVVTVP